jgi:glutamate synthase (ferredoxin)
MHQRLSRSNWPYCDSTYPDAFSGEKDSCGVGFIASVEGKQNHWVLTQALRGMSCM